MTTARLTAPILLLLLSSALARPVAAQSNRFFNPDLDSDTAGWALTSAPVPSGWDPEDRDGCAGSGSALVSGQLQPSFGFVASIAQCILVSPGETLQQSIEQRPIFASDPVSATLIAYFFAGGCLDIAFAWSSTPWGEVPFGSWSRDDAYFLVPAGATVAWVEFVLASPSPFDVLLDGAFVSELPYRIFSDGFEYNSTCRW